MSRPDLSPPRSLRIAFVCDWYQPRTGGIESYLRDICLELRARGHHPRVITSTPGETDDEIPVMRLPVPRLPGWDVVADPRVTRAVREAIVGADVVHGVSLYSPLAHVAMHAARRLGIASVLSSHSLLSPTGVLATSAWHRLHRWGDWPDVLTGVSRRCVAELSIASGRDDAEVLPNGVRLEDFEAPERPARSSATVASVMRLHPRKEPLRLIEAFADVHARLPEPRRPRLVVIGDGPQRRAVADAARAFGIAERVTLTGRVPRCQVAALLREADLFALPTRREAFGIAALEALCAGLPVVGMRGNGLSDLVASGDNGLLAEDTAGLAGAIFRLCDDPGLRVRLAARARESVAHFAWPDVTSRHLALYGRARTIAARRASASW